MVEITNELLDEIEASATRCGPGSWLYEGGDSENVISACFPIAKANRTSVLRHIARMDPPTTLALVAHIRVMESAAVQMAEALRLLAAVADFQDTRNPNVDDDQFISRSYGITFGMMRRARFAVAAYEAAKKEAGHE
jgi:hypothetical protein